MEQEEVSEGIQEINPVFYLACKKCHEEKLEQNMEAFVDDRRTFWVWCKNHNLPVFHAENAFSEEAFAAMNCSDCGKPGHTHH